MKEEFSPEKEGYSKQKYTEMQQRVLDTVISEYGGDVIAAAKAAGYSNPYQIAKALREELIEMAETVLARFAVPAALKVGEILTASDELPVVQANEKLAAARMILEKTNPKTQILEVSGDVKHGLFFLPNKRPVDEQ